MCGIVGFAGIESSSQRTKQALNALKHRGPDAWGEWHASSGLVWLGQQRLAILDLSNAGQQPMRSEDGAIWAVCNGEIYNYPELRKTLEGCGHIFYSNSDSEVVIHAYEEWGAQFVTKLRGMFAYIIWDDVRQQLHAARDHVGIKPLAYCLTNDGIILASEMSAILPLLPSKPEPNPLALAYIMTLGYVPSPLSMWSGLAKLEPGHQLCWQADGGVKIEPFWSPPTACEPTDDSEWQPLFESVLSEHLLSDVPIGLFLSGGLDSTSVAAGLAAMGESLHAITIGFPGSDDDEMHVAKAVADHLGFGHSAESLSATNVNTLLAQVAAAYDEPQSYSALMTMYQVSAIAAQQFKVVMSGDGGDEVFGGYKWYQNIGAQSATTVLKQMAKGVIRGGLPGEAKFVSRSPLHQHAWRLHPRFLPSEAQELLAGTGLLFDDEAMLAPLQKHWVGSMPLKRALQRVDLMTFCSDSILAKADRASMAHGLEVRLPLLDQRIIEWGLRRPISPREATDSKFILRDYLKGRVPDTVFEQPKRGFSYRALANYDFTSAIQTIADGYWVKSGCFSAEWRNIINRKTPYQNARIWNLLILTKWAEKWLV